MYKGDLDGYIATFKRLARDANYDLTSTATVSIFAHGIEPWLLRNILRRDTHPETFTQWTEAARTEIRKASFSQAMMHPHERKYKWV